MSKALLLRRTSLFNAGAAKFGSLGLADGVFQAPLQVDSFLSSTGVSGGTFIGGTIEAWVKTSATTARVAFGHDQWFWVGITAAGLPQAVFGATASQAVIVGTVAINDGLWHHIAFVAGASSRRLYVDGAQVATTVSGKTVGTSVQNFCIGGFNNSAGGSGSDWGGGSGTIDELRLSNIERYTGAYATPIDAFTLDPNTVALYHLEGTALDSVSPTIGAISVSTSGSTDTITYPAPTASNQSVAGVSLYFGTASGAESPTAIATNAGTSGGTFTHVAPTSGQFFYYVAAFDSSAKPSFSDPSNEVVTGSALPNTFIAPNDANIRYSPGNWIVDATNARSINSGAYFKAHIAGATSLALKFDVSDLLSPVPRIAYKIDGDPWVTQDISASIAIGIPTTNTWTKHLIEVIIIATTESQNRWNSPFNTQIRLTGIQYAGSSVATVATTPRAKSVLVFGDSITEGVRTLQATASSGKDTDRNDASVGWAYRLAAELGAEVGVIGFGRQGMTITGNGNVAAMSSAYALMWAGQARSFSVAPDLIICNQGTNDLGQGTSSATFQTAYVAWLNVMLAATPTTTLIGVMMPLNASYGLSTYQAIVAACNSQSRVKVIDTTGWFSTIDSSDSTHPYGNVNISIIAPLLAAACRTLLARGGTYVNVSGTARLVSPVRL
jgi:lysophospholipase L1-like esterase